MAYFSKNHLDALSVTPEELRKLDVSDRVNLAMAHFEKETREKEAFWNMIEGIATGLIPILVVAGILKRG